MKNTTNTNARAECRRDLRRAFKDAKIFDGLGDEIPDGAFTYWYNKSRDGTIGDYVIYEITDSDPNARADDAVFLRAITMSIDVFSTSSFESKKLSDTLERLENALNKHGFGVNQTYEDYEPDTKLYHAVFRAVKIF
jgi:hypothetical protein